MKLRVWVVELEVRETVTAQPEVAVGVVGDAIVGYRGLGVFRLGGDGDEEEGE